MSTLSSYTELYAVPKDSFHKYLRYLMGNKTENQSLTAHNLRQTAQNRTHLQEKNAI